MSTPQNPLDVVTCQRCTETARDLVTFDRVLGRFCCAVCSYLWRDARAWHRRVIEDSARKRAAKRP